MLIFRQHPLLQIRGLPKLSILSTYISRGRGRNEKLRYAMNRQGNKFSLMTNTVRFLACHYGLKVYVDMKNFGVGGCQVTTKNIEIMVFQCQFRKFNFKNVFYRKYTSKCLPITFLRIIEFVPFKEFFIKIRSSISWKM